MEGKEDLSSILPFLPLVLQSESLSWPPAVLETLETLETLSKGPNHSDVNTGEALFSTILNLRDSLGFNYSDSHSRSVAGGYSLYFDRLIPGDDSARWFKKVVPWMANLLLKLPFLLENHYHNALVNGIPTGLRILDTQMSGIVVLSQELIGALLACSFFCLFPSTNRSLQNLRAINFDMLFVCLHQKPDEKQQNKIKCIVHYFERICSHMPTGNVSFERKVIPLEYLNAKFWSKSTAPLCRFEVHTSGFIEDQPYEALEVDFANKLLGGGALKRGCVQEEIRFMINPELISGILFLPTMKENEAIEIIGAERFANYTGYSSSFRFSGNNVDQRDIDSMGRRKTRIVAMDALRRPGKRQYEVELVLREINKALCGFLDQRKDEEYQKLFLDAGISWPVADKAVEDATRSSTVEEKSHYGWITSLMKFEFEFNENQNELGIATGNWGCGAFGGDPEIKTMIQWLAASQALRPFVLYYTFGLDSLQNLDEVVDMIASRQYTVGDLWNKLAKYTSMRVKTSKRVQGESVAGFFHWLLSA